MARIRKNRDALDFRAARKYTVGMAKKARKKMGRPCKPLNEKWSARVTVRMTQEEQRRLQAEAKAAGMGMATYLLECWRQKETE